MLFQGQEFLEGGWFRDNVALDWDRSDDFHGIVKLYRDLIRLRLNRDSLSAGLTGSGLRVIHNNDAENVIAFQRWREHGVGDDVVVIANLSNQTRTDYRIGLPAAGQWQLLFDGDSAMYSDDFGEHSARDLVASAEAYDGLDASAEISIAPYTLLIYGWRG